MAFLDNYVGGGNIGAQRQNTTERLAAIAERAAKLTPPDLEERLLAKLAQGQALQEILELEWVTISDPRGTGGRLTVQPLLEFEPDDGDGIYTDLVIRGRNNDGDVCEVGRMALFERSDLHDTPPSVNYDGEPVSIGEETPWLGADAGLLMAIVEASLPQPQ